MIPYARTHARTHNVYNIKLYDILKKQCIIICIMSSTVFIDSAIDLNKQIIYLSNNQIMLLMSSDACM